MYCHKILEPSKYRYHPPHMAGNSVSHWIPPFPHLYNVLNLSLYFLSLVDIECGEQNKDEELNHQNVKKMEKKRKLKQHPLHWANWWIQRRKRKKLQWRKQWKLLSNSSARLLKACSYGQKLSRFPRKHFDRSNNVVLFIWRNVFPLTG